MRKLSLRTYLLSTNDKSTAPKSIWRHIHLNDVFDAYRSRLSSKPYQSVSWRLCGHGPDNSAVEQQEEIQVIVREARDYREMGYPVLHGDRNRVTNFDAAHQATVVQHTEFDQATAFYSQYDYIWEVIEMELAMVGAGPDESVHYGCLIPQQQHHERRSTSPAAPTHRHLLEVVQVGSRVRVHPFPQA